MRSISPAPSSARSRRSRRPGAGASGSTSTPTVFDGHPAERLAAFFDFATDELGVDAITVSPGYSYERAPDQQHFLNRSKTKELFRDIFARGAGKKWRFSQSSLFLDFLAGNQDFQCTPWGNPTRNVFGWQKPCYLIGEGYTGSFRALMDETDWDSYGTGRYEKVRRLHGPLRLRADRGGALAVEAVGRADGQAARDQDDRADGAGDRPDQGAPGPQYMFDRHVQDKLREIRLAEEAASEAREKKGRRPATNAA